MYSRRDFLKLFGIAVAGASLPISLNLPSVNAAPMLQGRTFNAQPVFKTPYPDAPIINTLWPETIVPILDSNADWYRVPGGFVPRSALQPMHPYQADAYHFTEGQPFWAEVAGSVASVRTHCAADAPLVARVGHGGISKVVDALPGEPAGWYAVEDNHGTFLGWTQSNRWRSLSDELPVSDSKTVGDNYLLQVDTRSCKVTALDQGKIVLQSDCSIGQAMQPGDYQLRDQQIGGNVWTLGNDIYHGIPWQMVFGEHFTLAGIYWHNRFGSYVPGPSVQVSPLVARWLYGWLGEQSTVQVL